MRSRKFSYAYAMLQYAVEKKNQNAAYIRITCEQTGKQKSGKHMQRGGKKT
jgi:hypothetical protein